MPASKPELPVENPSGLIRSRMREKRIFEARFLYRQLGSEIGEKEKGALERELSGLLTQVQKMQQQAREYVAKGQNHLAASLYADIEQIAIDVPGLAEEKKALAGAEALLARIKGKPVAPKPETVPPKPEIAPEKVEVAFPQTMAPPESKPGKLDFTTVLERCRQLPRLWLLAGCVGLAILLLLFFRGTHQEKSLSVPLKPSLTQPAAKQPVKPLVPPAPPVKEQPLKEEVVVEEEFGEPAKEAEPSLPSSLKVGELQVKESDRE